jgi:hypothetical protein
MTIELIVAVVAAVGGPIVALMVQRGLDRQRHDERENAQTVALAVLAQKVDDIPEKMNGKIIKALEKHVDGCPSRKAVTNPHIKLYQGEILE